MTSRPPAIATATLRCRLGWVPTVEWAGLYLAEEDGHLDTEGLAVDLIPGGPGCAGAARSVADGEADVGIASDLLGVLEVIGEGVDLRVVGATMSASPLGIAWPVDRGVPTMAALRGRRIGAGTSGDRAVLDALFRVNGLEPDYEFATIGHDASNLLAGRVDAMCCSTISQPIAAERRGHPLATATFAALGLPMPADVVVVPAATIADHRADVVGFLRALSAGWTAAVADPARAAEIAHRRFGSSYGFDLDDARAEHERQLPFVASATASAHPALDIDVAGVAASRAALALAGVTGLPDEAAVFDLTLLPEAARPRGASLWTSI